MSFSKIGTMKIQTIVQIMEYFFDYKIKYYLGKAKLMY